MTLILTLDLTFQTCWSSQLLQPDVGRKGSSGRRHGSKEEAGEFGFRPLKSLPHFPC